MSNWIVSKKVFSVFAVVAAAIIGQATAFAQVEQRSQITIQGTGLFTRTTTGDSVSLERIPQPAPKAIEPEPSLYGADPEVRVLADGTTAEGTVFAIRSFRVRIGSPGLPGQTIHRWTRVSRVRVIIGIDNHSHVRCTGYVEHNAEAQDEPDIARVARICLSVHKQR